MPITERQTKVNRARAKAQVELQRKYPTDWNDILNDEYAKEGLDRKPTQSK